MSGAVSVEVALPIFSQICNGLAYAQERDILNDTEFAKANPFLSDLEDIIYCILARSPDDRYVSLSQVVSDLPSVERSKNYRQGNAKSLLLGQSKYGGTPADTTN